jgi:hypothetical protein
MSRDSKERLILSAAGGAAVPALYFLGLVVLYSAVIDFSSAPSLILPLAWPLYLYSLFPTFLDLQATDDHLVTFLIVAGTDFVFYSLLTYALIGWRQRMPRLR